MSEPWPDFEGGCPSDWDPRHWMAATHIHDGGTQRAAAHLVGVAVGTLSRWKASWRKKYGPEFLAGDHARALPRAREIASAYALTGDGSRNDWQAVRHAAAAANGVTADLARELAQMVLIRYLDDPDQIASLTPIDALNLAKTANLLEKRADDMIGVSPMGAAAGAGTAEEVPVGILDGLDAPVGEAYDELMDAAAENAETFLYLIEGDADAVETTGRQVG